jgi:acetyl esterase/lipase
MNSVTAASVVDQASIPLPDPLKELYTSWKATLAAKPDMSIGDMRVLFDHWGDVTAEPRAVDYVEVDAGGVEAMWLIPRNGRADRVLLCTHGGGYVTGSMYSHRKMFGHFAKTVGCRGLVINYGLAPEKPHPAQVDDAVTAYRWLLEHERITPPHIAFIGDSAGGGLAVTTMLRARDKGLPLPVACVALSPWFDLEAKGETFVANAHLDVLVSREICSQMAIMVAGPDGDIRDPLLSPLNPVLLRGLPPILIQVSGDEALLDDSRLFVERAKQAGVDVSIDISRGMQHVFPILAGGHPTADAAIARVGDWLRPKLGLA